MARGRPSKKGEIVSAATELFTQKGYQGTSVDQVVVTAAVSKPTVYSNFPTKLVLWESVLEAIIEQANTEMSQALVAQQNHVSSSSELNSVISGWISLWKVWSSRSERLAVYRILLGEQHKMAATTVSLFAQFEAVLEKVLLAWLEAHQMPVTHFFALKAISKEALLTPTLLHQDALSDDDLVSQLSVFINAKAES
ncbi:TetR/AcrR family transcriptional regulator [Marinomonas pollencensis]|uniref:TetR family transcriptional regulator n=1 Tax=Marinomonas pollencensis TaxID=491954 RepID=A0A3E0DSQ0_9GAMM|nr:TetR/AcrR family transcriptional regulator [Marinomonas pollencensis]REG86552.1 TetR family transcriptional regulator [Marinomonas pollencensis]